MTASEKIEQEKEEIIENSKLKTEGSKKLMEKQYDMIAGHLCDRCDKDIGFAGMVTQAHKTFKKCLDFLQKKAKEFAVGNCAMIDDDTVYGWSEEYYELDDKAEEEAKAKKAKETESAAKAQTSKPKAEKPKEKPKPASTAKRGKVVYSSKAESKKLEQNFGFSEDKIAEDRETGQMNLFDLWGEMND